MASTVAALKLRPITVHPLVQLIANGFFDDAQWVILTLKEDLAEINSFIDRLLIEAEKRSTHPSSGK